MRGIIFIAPPAAGKGTQSDLICDKYGFEHISTGELLRDASEEDNLEALYIKEKIDSGELVDDELIIELIDKKLHNLKTNGFILDGFPRNLVQAKMLNEMIKNFNLKQLYVFNIDVEFSVVMQRFTGRITCPDCGNVYNKLIDELKPKKDNYCNDCDVMLETRADDNEETFTKRFELYADETEPLISYYMEKGVLHRINGNLDTMQIFNQIVNILEGE